MPAGEMTLRVANVRSEKELELIRDVLDELGAEYEYLGSDPEDSFPQTAYFELSSELADDAEDILARLSTEHGFDAEILD